MAARIPYAGVALVTAGDPLTLPKTPSLRLDGKRRFVTGAGRGIGFAAAVALADAGAQVTLCARTAADIEAAAEAVRATGAEAEALVLDVTDHAAVTRALDERPAFHVLVNNAGTNRPKPFLDVSEEDYDAIMTLNGRASFFVAQAVARGMVRETIAGSIINITSQMGHVGGALRTVYCMSKWGVEGMTKAMAIDLAGHGIRVNSVAPTFIETAMTASFIKGAYRDHILSKIKLGRLGQIEDVMGPILFLASDASALMTGTSMVVDGGWTAG